MSEYRRPQIMAHKPGSIITGQYIHDMLESGRPPDGWSPKTAYFKLVAVKRISRVFYPDQRVYSFWLNH
jgi:hypothetical protein